MPASQTGEHRGLEFRGAPDFWGGRLWPFPFYFESTHTTFRVDIRRSSEAAANDGVWDDNRISFRIVLANGQWNDLPPENCTSANGGPPRCKKRREDRCESRGSRRSRSSPSSRSTRRGRRRRSRAGGWGGGGRRCTAGSASTAGWGGARPG